MEARSDIKSLTRDDLAARFAEWQQPAYRVDQLLQWLYARRVANWEAMTNLPRSLRALLEEHFTLHALDLARKQGARDTTRKFLWRLADHSLIESVLIPANPALYGDQSDRHTLCISTQVGCAYGCKFCASGLDGWKRNLLPNEIVEQIMAIERLSQDEAGRRTEDAAAPPAERSSSRMVDNIVVMGMGEPLANYENLLKALRILNAPWGGGIGARKITISTSGLAPQIRKLADEPEQFRLAISLHGATDEVRAKIMPVNRKFPLKELTAALDYYQSKKNKMLTFEFILIAGVNDSLEQTKPLATLAKRLHAKVNLIPMNPVDGSPLNAPEFGGVDAFQEQLRSRGVAAFVRRTRGDDIAAACGQLALHGEKRRLRVDYSAGGSGS